MKKITLEELRSKNSTALQVRKPATLLPTKDGNLLINYHGIFFFMSTLGYYIPWKRTLKCGELIKTNEYGRLKNLIGADKLKELNPFLEKCAANHAKGIAKDPLYTLNKKQREEVARNRTIYAAKKEGVSEEIYLANWEAAKKENVPILEYLRRKKIRAERARNRALKAKQMQSTAVKSKSIRTRVGDTGYTHFLMACHPSFAALKEKISATG